MNQGISEARPWPIQVVVNAKVRHRALITLMVWVSLAFTVALAVYGWDYYWLDQTERPLSPMHAVLKPSGTVGLKLGILGMFLTIRKITARWQLRRNLPNTCVRALARTARKFHSTITTAEPVDPRV